MKKRVNKWVGKTSVKKHKGALHRMLGYGKREKIPSKVLFAHRHDSGLLGERVRFAINARKFHHKKRRAHHGHGR